jgi:alanine racemase
MKTSRRSFFGAGAAALGLPLARGRAFPAESDGGHSSFDPWVEVHSANLRHNVSEVARRVGGRPILAVIKNDGYGLGVVNVARVLEPLAAISGFAVVKLQEAIRLRDGGIKKPVLLMGPFGERNLEEAVARDVMPMIYTPQGETLERIAAATNRPISIHVCVDTGIGRVGVPYREAADLIRDLARRPSIKIQGTMMTFTEDADFDREQLRRFESLCRALAEQGIDLGRKHAASSFALFQHADAFFDMVRPGMALFGIYPELPFRGTGILDLKPAVSLKARVAYVKKLPEGESAGYNRAYLAKQDVWVATIPVGHADGWPRVAAKGARVRVGGKLYPVIATVSASHTIVEIGDQPEISIGDVATFFDAQEGSRPEDVSAACGASVYDLTMHLNPLLPRRVV